LEAERVQLPSTDEDDEPWATPPSGRRKELAIVGPLPHSIKVVLGNQVYIDRANRSTALVNCILRLAAFQNPEFYAAQAMCLSIFGKPRVISCAELLQKYIALPRGCLDALLHILSDLALWPNCETNGNRAGLSEGTFLAN
jgi:hypothetical protein